MSAALRVGLTLAGIGLMALSATLFAAAATPDQAAGLGLLAFALGVAALTSNPFTAYGFRRLKSLRRASPEASTDSTPSALFFSPRPPGESGPGVRANLPIVFLGTGLLALVAAAGDDRARGLTAALGAHGQFGLWCGGIALVAWGLCGAPRPRRPQLDRREAIPLIALLIVALALRLWGLDQLRVLVDEIHVATGVTYFWDNPQPQLLRPIGTLDPFPRVFPYGVAQSVALFGRTFAALRVIPALMGTATVGALYLLARTLFDRRTALAAAALLATLPPFLHFSRLALINSADPLFGTLALAFLARALRDGRRSDFVLTGVMLGLTQYFHEAGRLLFPALAALWIAGWALARLRIRPISDSLDSLRRVAWRGPAVGLLAALLVTAPLIYVQRTQPEQFDSRLEASAQSPNYWESLLHSANLRPQLERIRDAAFVFVRTPDASTFFGGRTPLVLPPFVPLLLLGAAFALRRRAGWPVLAWLALTILGNSLLQNGQMSVRFLPAFPAVALLLALGVTETVRRLVGSKHAGLVTAAVVVAVSAASAFAYFGPHLTYFNLQIRNTGAPDGYDALLRAADLPPYSVVHLISRRAPFSQFYAEQLLRYLTDDVIIRVRPPEQLTADTLANLSRSTPQVFFVEPQATEIIARIRRTFPTATEPQPSTSAIPGPTFAMIVYTPPTSGETRSSP